MARWWRRGPDLVEEGGTAPSAGSPPPAADVAAAAGTASTADAPRADDAPPAAPAGTPRPLLADPLPLLGFFTRLPVKAGAGIDDLVVAFPLVPLVGYVTGAAAAAFSLLLGPVIPSFALAALLLALLVGLTGFNQMDGLLDLGDGLMVHGGPARRREAMHDHHTGVGAVAFVLFTYLVAFGGLAGLAAPVAAAAGAAWFTVASRNLALNLVVAEVLCRTPYLLLAWRGRPSHDGLGAPFLRSFGFRHVLVGALLAAPVAVAALWIGWLPPLVAFLAVVAVALVLLRTAGRLLGGIGGDVMGASQELARAAALVALAAAQILALRLGW